MLLIGIGVWLIAVMLILMFIVGATEEKKVVLLKPLDLEKSNIKATLMLEIAKCMEEDKEFINGVLKGDIDNTIEEFWDSAQTKLNVMDMIGIPVDMVYKDLDKHIRKMIKRGYVFKG
jgi:phosphoribosyl-ATP pyrophosphohydrolase